MRVYEVAKEFKVEPEKMMTLLRGLGVRVVSEASAVDDATVAKLRARMERERRAGHGDTIEESLVAVIEAVQPAATKTRRRKKEDLPPEPPAPEPVEEVKAEVVVDNDVTADPIADAVEAMEAEAATNAKAKGDTPETAVREADKIIESIDASALFADVPKSVPKPPAPNPFEPAPRTGPVPTTPRPTAEEARPRLRRAAEVLGRTTKPAAPPAAPQRERQERSDRPARTDRDRPAAAAGQAPAASAAPGGQVRIQAEGFTNDGRRKKGDKKGKKGKARRVDQGAVQDNITRVMAELKGGGKKRGRGASRAEAAAGRMEQAEERKRLAAEEAVTIRVNEVLSVAELAELIDIPANQIVGSAFKNLGLMVTINQRLDFDQIELLLDEFGFKAVREEEYAGDTTEEQVVDTDEQLSWRPPIVTIMGHVDHGKTSLLDYIRKTNVIAGESGGITQHIGAYHVELPDNRTITFLDTPGHAAFTAMRARGAEVTDLVVLVVAADDSVMPQTIEAISHAKNAGVPIIVAMNKIDLPGANPDKIKQDLLQHEVVVEEFGGAVLSQGVSAKKGTGVQDLLDKILLQAEMLDLKANADRPAQGVVIESRLDVGKGSVATVLITNGTLRVGDSFVCGHYDGKVRAMLDERGKTVPEAGPGIPVQLLGISGVPQAGDALLAMDANKASEIAGTRQRLDREKQLRVKSRGVKLTDISRMLAEGQIAYLNLVIKGDVDGSVQALSDALGQLSTGEVKVEVIHRGVGAISESDVLLATAAGAIIIGFHVRPTGEARQLAAREDVDIKLYNIIYEAVEDVKSALEGMLTPDSREVMYGVASVRQIFKVPRIGTVAGCYVTEGMVDRKNRVRVVRDAVQIYEGELSSLKRIKDDVREVREGFECGLSVQGFNDIKIGDTIECYRIEEVARTLAQSSAADN
jgi:translation initiation factor IF-2